MKKQNWIVGILWVFMISMGLWACSAHTAANLLISDEEEVDMGRQMAEEIEADSENYPLLPKSHPLHKYIDSIGQALVQYEDKRKDDITYHFRVVDQPGVMNAFAVPGGFIYIYTDIIKYSKSEEEIAGVVGHEIGHVANRHSMQRLVKQYGVSFLLQTLLGEENAKWGNMIFSLTQLKNSREHESESDSLGVYYMDKAGYNPYGAKIFFETLDSLSGGSSDWAEMISTHPNPGNRAEDLERIITQSYPTHKDEEFTPIRVGVN